MVVEGFFCLGGTEKQQSSHVSVLPKREDMGFSVEGWYWSGANASSQDPKGRVLGALQGDHVGAGEVGSPGRASVFKHRPNKLLVKSRLLFLGKAECGGGHSPHHVHPGAILDVDLCHVVAEGRAAINHDPKNLGGLIGWDGSAKEGDTRGAGWIILDFQTNFEICCETFFKSCQRT